MGRARRPGGRAGRVRDVHHPPRAAPRPRGSRLLTAEVVAVFGPTASGKSAVAEALADRLGTEVVSADAMQVYRGLPILTNQPDRPTRLVAIREPTEEMSVGAYAALAHAAIDELVTTHGVTVVAGGTGLYLRAALADLRVPPRPTPEARARWQALVAEDPVGAYARLGRLDPAAAAAIHPNDARRLVRALELAEIGATLVPGVDRLWGSEWRRPTLVIGLEVEARELERRIRARTVAMLERGVVAEAHAALARPLSRTAEKVLGLRELVDLPEDEALERVVVRTRRYAAYQRKWMRRVPGIVTVNAARAPEEIVEEILAMLHAEAGDAPV